MGSSWVEKRLGDVVELKRGYDLPKKTREDGDVPVVSSSGHSGTHSEAKVDPPGVVTGRYGTIGEVFMLDEPFWPLNTTLYVRDFKGNDPRYIYYLLQTVDYALCSDKAAVPGVNRNHLHELPVTLTEDESEQRAIAEVLGSLDDKIDLNRRMNRTLESMARALFKSWFVDFDPVHANAAGKPSLPPDLAALFPAAFESSALGEVPEGWDVRGLDEIADYLNGLALQKYPGEPGKPSLPRLKIAQLRKGDTEGAERSSTDVPAKYVVEDGDVIFSWSGSLLVRLWTGGKAALNQHLFKVTSDEFPRWFYYLWTQHHLDDFQATAASKATTMGHIKRHHLSDAQVVVPPSNVLQAPGDMIAPLHEQMVTNDLQSRTLAGLRDALLPMLMSGELSIEELLAPSEESDT